MCGSAPLPLPLPLSLVKSPPLTLHLPPHPFHPQVGISSKSLEVHLSSKHGDKAATATASPPPKQRASSRASSSTHHRGPVNDAGGTTAEDGGSEGSKEEVEGLARPPPSRQDKLKLLYELEARSYEIELRATDKIAGKEQEEEETMDEKEARVLREADEQAKAFAHQMDELQAERIEAMEDEYLRHYETFLKQVCGVEGR